MAGEALVTVKKVGQPTLRITQKSLVSHAKHGWVQVEDEAPKVVEIKPSKNDTSKG